MVRGGGASLVRGRECSRFPLCIRIIWEALMSADAWAHPWKY